MKKARLEIDKIKILKGKEKWRLYFVITIHDPSNPQERILFIQPSDTPIETSKNQGNEIIFNYGGIGEDGKIMFINEIPESKSLCVSIYVMHSREKTRNLAQMTNQMQSSTGGKLLKQASKLAGVSNPVIMIAGTAINLVTGFLSKIKDKQLGCVTCDESFNDEFLNYPRITRKRMADEIEMEYAWIIDNK